MHKMYKETCTDGPVYVLPLLEYNSVVRSPQSVQDIELVERVQRRFTKRLPGRQFLASWDVRFVPVNGVAKTGTIMFVANVARQTFLLREQSNRYRVEVVSIVVPEITHSIHNASLLNLVVWYHCQESACCVFN